MKLQETEKILRIVILFDTVYYLSKYVYHTIFKIEIIYRSLIEKDYVCTCIYHVYV